MSRFTEEHIFNYLDQVLTAQEIAELEQEMQNDPELKTTVEQLRTSHVYFLENQVEAGPEQLADHVMAEVTELSRKEYYRPSGLFNNTSFLLIIGVLTAIVSFLSLVSTGHFDLSSLVSRLNEMGIFSEGTFMDGMISNRAITNSMLVIYGVLALVLLDRLLLNPLFRRRARQLGFN